MTTSPEQVASEAAIAAAGPNRIGIGCMALTGLYGRVLYSEARAVIQEAINLGIRLFDTAPLYKDGANEKLLGDATAKTPEAFITTKFGLTEDNQGTLVRNSRPDTIRTSVEASLRRLRREKIDLLLQHRSDPCVSDHEVAGAVSILIQEGKVGAFGLSGTSVDRILPVSTYCPVAAIQNELSVTSKRDCWNDPVQASRFGSYFIAYSPMAKGLLTRTKISSSPDEDDYRSRLPAFEDHNRYAIQETMKIISSQHNVTPATIALCWVLSRGSNVIAIPGPRRIEHLSALQAISKIKLSQADIFQMEASAEI